MSSGIKDAEMARIWSATIIQSYGYIASAALVFFEYIITFSDEAELIWTNMLNGPSILFMLNRLSMLVYVGGQVFEAPSWPAAMQPACKYIYFVSVTSQLIPLLVWAGFSALRVYAITDRAKCVTLVVFMFLLAPLIPQLIYLDISALKMVNVTDENHLCSVRRKLNRTVDNGVVILSGACLIIADVIILTVTGWKTFSIVRDGRSAGIRTPLATMLLGDGLLYFLYVYVICPSQNCDKSGERPSTGLNLLQIGVYLSRSPSNVTSLLADVFDPQVVTSVIITRFILSLRRFSSRAAVMNVTNRDLMIPTSAREVTEAQFASRFVGDMGGPLDRVLGFGGLDAEESGDDEEPRLDES